MKISRLLTLAFLFISSAHASMVNLTCVTEWPTTSTLLRIINKEAVVTVYHHNGHQFMPLHMGIVTPNDIDNLSKKAESFAKLGDRYEFRWDLSDCEKKGELFQCTNGKPATINGVLVKPFSIYTMKNQIDSMVGKFSNYEVALLIDFDGQSHHLSMTYQPWECAFGDEALKRANLLK